MKRITLLILICTVLSCKTTKPTRPDEVYKQPEEMPPSSIRLPLSIGLDDLEKTINEQIDMLFEDGTALPDDYGNGLKVAVKKNGRISLSATGHFIHFKVPLDLQVEKDITLTKAKANGSILLHFQTKYNIDEHWNIKTETTIEGHDWAKKPMLDLGIIKLPVESLADQLINRSKATLTREIDKQLEDRFALKEFAQLAVDTLQQPFLVSPEYDAWLSVRPKQIIISPLETVDRKVNTTILLEALTEISVSGRNDLSDPLTVLPALQEKEVDGDGFQFYFQTKVPYALIEAEAKKQILGEVYGEGKRKVKVEDIKVFGQKDKLVINATLSGSYNGSIYLLGKPVYNPAKGQLELENLDFELKTKEFLKKSMAWLLQRNLKKQLQESLYYPVQAELDQTKEELREQMKVLVNHPQLAISGNVDDLTIRQLFVEKEHVLVSLFASGQVNAEIREFELLEDAK